MGGWGHGGINSDLCVFCCGCGVFGEVGVFYRGFVVCGRCAAGRRKVRMRRP